VAASPWKVAVSRDEDEAAARFLAGGPSIPDQLLVARDGGRVIFFCKGAVSRARAGLADFFGLAKQVLETPEGGAVKRLSTRTVGSPSLLSADPLLELRGWIRGRSCGSPARRDQ
jgi:hypothetical protein